MKPTLDLPRKLLLCTLAYSLYAIIMGGFETALVLRLRNSITDVLLCQGAGFLTIYLGLLAARRALAAGRARLALRLAFAFQGLACAALVLGFDRVSTAVDLLPFFFLRGAADGLFTGVRSVLLLRSVDNQARDGWVLQLQFFTILLGLVVPLVSGLAITFLGSGHGGSLLPEGYRTVLVLAGCLSLGFSAFVPRLPTDRQILHGPRWGRLLADRRNRAWIILLAVGCFSGVTASVAAATLNFQVLATEFNLGIFSAAIALASAVFYGGLRVLFRRRASPRLSLVLTGTVGEFFSRLVYSFFANLPGLVVKSLLDSFLVPFRGILGENIVRRRQEIAAAHLETSLVEIVVFQETVILVMRLAAAALLWVLVAVVPGNTSALCQLLLWLCLPVGFVEFLLLRSMERADKTP